MANGPARDLSSIPERIGGALRQALIAGYGPEAGAAAAVGAVSWGAVHPERLGSVENPTAYLYRIGRRRARRSRWRPRHLPDVPDEAAPWIDSAVPQILLDLSPQQRVVVLLRHGYGWSEAEVAGLLGVDGSAIRRAVGDGTIKLRSRLDFNEDGQERALHNQLAAYAEVLDKAAPPLDELLAEEGRRKQRSVRWQAGPVLTTSLIGVLVIGGALALRSSRSPTARDDAGSSTTLAAAVLPVVDSELVNRSAIRPEMFSNWEYQFAGPGAVTVVDGTYHMLSAAYGDNMATVAYAVSDDGVVWSQAADRPVLDLSEAPWAPLEIDRAAPRSVIVDRDGSWQLFFDIGWYDRGADQLKSSIGRVVARDPAGTWIYDAVPIVTRNSSYPWMADQVSSPSVVAGEGGLVMLFVGTGSMGRVVGLAHSQHGAEWDVRPGPVYAASGDGDGDGGDITQVDLVEVPGGMAMLYGGETADRRGLALSAGGLEWVAHPDNPLVTAADASAASLFDSEFVRDGDSLLAYLEIDEARGGHEVAVLRLEIDLPDLFAALLGN